MKWIEQARSRGLGWILFVTLIACLLGWPEAQIPTFFEDSGSYVRGSKSRLPFYSFFVRLFGKDHLLSYAQTILSMVSWCGLGAVVAGRIGTLVGACFALSLPLYQWNLMVLSESTSLSLLAASLAMTMLLFRKRSALRFACWCAVVTGFSLTRSTNAFLLPFLTVPFLTKGWRHGVPVILVGGTLLILANQWTSGSRASLKHMSMTNVYMTRILPDKTSCDFFRSYGMPIDETVMRFAGQRGNVHVQALFRASPGFEEWVKDKGLSIYAFWLVTQGKSYVSAW